MLTKQLRRVESTACQGPVGMPLLIHREGSNWLHGAHTPLMCWMNRVVLLGAMGSDPQCKVEINARTFWNMAKAETFYQLDALGSVSRRGHQINGG